MTHRGGIIAERKHTYRPSQNANAVVNERCDPVRSNELCELRQREREGGLLFAYAISRFSRSVINTETTPHTHTRTHTHTHTHTHLETKDEREEHPQGVGGVDEGVGLGHIHVGHLSQRPPRIQTSFLVGGLHHLHKSCRGGGGEWLRLLIIF